MKPRQYIDSDSGEQPLQPSGHRYLDIDELETASEKSDTRPATAWGEVPKARTSTSRDLHKTVTIAAMKREPVRYDSTPPTRESSGPAKEWTAPVAEEPSSVGIANIPNFNYARTAAKQLKYPKSSTCMQYLESMLPAQMDTLNLQESESAIAQLEEGSGEYAIGELLARGAESVIYKGSGEGTGYAFCVKAIRNRLNSWLGSNRNDRSKLQDVSYKTKFRHLSNELKVGRLLIGSNPAEQVPVRIFSLRAVKRLGLELGWDLLMERINGIDLSDKGLLKTLTISDKLCACIEIAQAIGTLHQKRLVHLDIKPSNFMLERSGRVRLIDFGISVPSGYKPATVAGTAGFLAPEQICRGALQEDTDIFALGVTFAILFGAQPLPQDAKEILQRSARSNAAAALAGNTFSALQATPPELAPYPKIAEVIRSCSIYKREERIRSCNALINQLISAAAASGITL